MIRKVVLVNTSDQGGGAERFAVTLREGLEKRGIDAWLLVGDQKTVHPKILPFYQSPHVDYRPYGEERQLLKLNWLRAWDQEIGLEDFRNPYSRLIPQLTGSVPDAVILVNLHGGYFDLRALPRLSQQIPTLLVLQDCWPMTGHCAYPMNCDRWKTGCGSCPDLKRPPAIEKDATHLNWRCKKSIYRDCRFRVTACSQWLLNFAQESILKPAKVQGQVIPNGVNLTTFSPGSKLLARRALGLAEKSDIILFAANLSRSNPYKGYEILREAVEMIAHGSHLRPLCCLAIGEEGATELIGSVELRHVPFLTSPHELAQYYRATDLYVHAAQAEAFGIVLAEAMACGAPIVATEVGGIPEVVRHHREGLLCASGDAKGLARSIVRLLNDPIQRAHFARNGIHRARAHFDEEQLVDSYLQCLTEMVERRRYSLAG